MRSFGFELEWANIDKQCEIPAKLGVWEGNGSHSEIDIINTPDTEVFEAAWPNRRWGGEINTTPTKTVEQQIDHIEQLFDFFKRSDKFGPISVSPISNGHVHVYDDAFMYLDVLKRLYDFTLRNQEQIIKYWLSLDELPEYKGKVAFHKSAYRYLRNDGGKKLSANFKEPVANAKTIDEFQRAIVPHAKDSGNILWARAGRQGINLHSLRHTGTIEFRCMKASVEPSEIEGQLRFVDEFVNRVLDGGADFTKEELATYRKPETDPHSYFDKPAFLVGLNDWWDTRDQRKKAGEKVRVGYIEAE